MSPITIRSCTGGTPKEIMEKARAAYEARQKLEAQQVEEGSSGESPTEDKSDHAMGRAKDVEEAEPQ